MAKKQSIIFISAVVLSIMILYLALFRIEGFSYTCTCKDSNGVTASASAAAPAPAPAPAAVDLNEFYMKPPPSGGCPTGLVEFAGAESKYCGCPAELQSLKDGKCACPDKSTYTPWELEKNGPPGFPGTCLCDAGTSRDGPKCVTTCRKDMVSKVQTQKGISIARCQFPD
jgi:hypothetical protein